MALPGSIAFLVPFVCPGPAAPQLVATGKERAGPCFRRLSSPGALADSVRWVCVVCCRGTGGWELDSCSTVSYLTRSLRCTLMRPGACCATCSLQLPVPVCSLGARPVTSVFSRVPALGRLRAVEDCLRSHDLLVAVPGIERQFPRPLSWLSVLPILPPEQQHCCCT